jgi:cob(I)alamin adenosyltransferase
MKIYTRSGDKGETDLPGGGRVWKNSPRLAACGTLDELNAVLGLVRSENLPEDLDRLVEGLQNELLSAGSQLATVASAKTSCPTIEEKQIQALETAIDRYEARLPPIKGFILPGGVRSAALFHVARTICRRAERELVTASQVEKHLVSSRILAYINRLSDLLYVLARFSNAQANIIDRSWEKS